MLFLLPTDTCYGLAGEFTEQDYNEIYRLKGRDFSKLLAILVEDYADMKTYIEISDEQVDFLRGYPHPWSFLGRKRTDFVLPEWMDSEKYQMLSIRVASVCLGSPPNQTPLSSTDTVGHLPLSGEQWGQYHFPLFLTSANLSGMPESKTLEEARKSFPLVEGYDGGVCDSPPSDIFSIGEDGELQYIRRNYDKTPE